ncbi:MAG: hypothetical protein E6J79_02895 [Deltaproteobacteria bacterium]|nr:MAG: hypothetical protein E6J79_02895 [Deltaproteobacteria bacterium]
MRIDASGDVVAAGSTLFPFPLNVVKLSGSTGAEIWRTNAGGAGAEISDVAIDDADDPVVAGKDTTVYGFFVAKLDAGSGTPVWMQTVGGTFESEIGRANAVALGAGHVAAAGRTPNNLPYSSGPGFTVVDFAGGIGGKRLRVRDKAIDASKRKLKALSKDPRFLAGAVGSADDPTVSGAVLTLANPTTGETFSAPLPAGNWTAAPLNIPGNQSYRYLDRSLAAGPCNSVIVHSGKLLLATCVGTGLGFSLDEPTQGSLDVRLTIGTAFEYCMHFGGTVRKDQPTSGASLGFFDAADGPPPSCPAGGP